MLRFIVKRILQGIPLIIGVTLISFLLMVYFGPDVTYELISKNSTNEEIAAIRHQLGYDQPVLKRYVDYLHDLFTFDLGSSFTSGIKVVNLFKRTVPVTAAQAIPGFLLGNFLGIAIAFIAAYFRSRWQDRLVMTLAVIGMSISFLIVIITAQIVFCSSYGLAWFPVRGWDMSSLGNYLSYVTVPTIATVFVSLGYNTRFYRAIIVEELNRDYVRTAKAFGASVPTIFFKYIFKNCLIPVSTRIIFTLPFILVGGSLLIETYFGIPGIGREVYEAIVTGDQPVLKAVVGIVAVMYVFVLTFVDIFYQFVDPRISLK